jgi:predicted dehydrogenase
VALVTPHNTHCPLTVQALNAGKHVVTEKVMCLDVAEADAMIGAAKKHNRVLSVFQNRRWDNDYLTVKQAVKDGLLGDLFLIESTVNGYGEPGGWRREKRYGGGMLYDWGAHLIDQIVQLMLPARPVRVFADLQHRVWNLDTETQALVMTQFSNGCTAIVDVGSISWQNKPRWIVRGEKGAFKGEWGDAALRTQVGGLRGEFKLEMVKGDWKEYYRNLSAVLNDGAELIVKPEEVRISIQIIEAAFKSAESGQAISL